MRREWTRLQLGMKLHADASAYPSTGAQEQTFENVGVGQQQTCAARCSSRGISGVGDAPR